MTVEERIEKVEMELARTKRHNRLLLAGVLLSFVLLTVAMTAGVASREDIVNAKQFNVLDDNGKTRVTLAVSKDGPGLKLLNANGKACVNLGIDDAILGPRLTLYDTYGNPRATLGGEYLCLLHADGKTQVMLQVSKDFQSLGLVDASGKVRAGLSVSKDGSLLELYDANGKLRAGIGATQTTTLDGKVTTYPESSLILFNPDGKVRWQAPPE